MTALWVEVTDTRGSAPRDRGTVMKVTPVETEGTIGGGALEHQAIATARKMLSAGQRQIEQRIPLGPGLGQCCGGSVTLSFSDRPQQTDSKKTVPLDAALVNGVPAGRLWVWGAGHVGRAVVRVFAPVQTIDITWIDESADRFPKTRPDRVKVTPSTDMPRLARFAPQDAHHLIFTYDHDIDLALCAGLLKRGFTSCGLIGSATKWARFQRRLRSAGLSPDAITCPIGDPRHGKHPDDIAHSTATALLRFMQNLQEPRAVESVARS